MADPEVKIAEVSKTPVLGELTKRTAAVGEFQSTTLQWIVRFTIAVLKEMRDDPQIGLGLELVKAPIYGAINTMRVECESPTIQEFVEAEIRRIWRGATRSCLTAVDFGYAAHEKLWSVDADGVHIDQLKDLDPGWCVALHDEDGDFAGIRWTPQPSFAIGTSFIQPVTVPAEKAFWFTHWKEFGNLYGRNRMHKSSKYWKYCENFILLAGRYTQRCAIPRYKAWAPQGMVPNAEGAMVDGIEEQHRNVMALRAGGSITMPSDRDEKGNHLWDVDMLDDKLAGLDALLKLIDHCETMKLRGMIVPDTVATKDGKGAYNIAEAHIEVFMTLEEQLLFDLLDTFEKYLVPQLVLYNFGPTAPKVKLVSDGLSEDTKQRLGDLVEKLIAQPVTADLVAEAIDVVKILEDADVPTKDPEDYETGEDPEPEKIAAPVIEPNPQSPDEPPKSAAKLRSQPRAAVPHRHDLIRLSGIRDERDAVIARGVLEAGKHFDTLIGRAKKN